MSREIIVPPKVDLQIAEIDLWWRTNREKAPGLFEEELAVAFETISATPRAGRRYPSPLHPDARRLVLRATRFHLYYVEDENKIVLLSIWGAIRGAGPDLSNI